MKQDIPQDRILPISYNNTEEPTAVIGLGAARGHSLNSIAATNTANELAKQHAAAIARLNAMLPQAQPERSSPKTGFGRRLAAGLNRLFNRIDPAPKS